VEIYLFIIFYLMRIKLHLRVIDVIYKTELGRDRKSTVSRRENISCGDRAVFLRWLPASSQS
jgi:hypothetical protein